MQAAQPSNFPLPKLHFLRVRERDARGLKAVDTTCMHTQLTCGPDSEMETVLRAQSRD